MGEIDERFQRLERRVRRIEAQLGLGLAEELPKPIEPIPLAREAQPMRMPEPLAPPIEPIRIELPTTPPPLPIPQPIPVSAPLPPPLPSEQATSAGELEHTIGLKWTGWVGAIVLVIGAVLGVQFAYVNHWFGHLPPAARLAMIFSAGLALIGAGEYVFRRVNPISAASLFGAGVATLFVGAYAGFDFFDLYNRSTCMSLMAASTLVGAAVAMRGNLVSIAVLSLIGANIAPLLVATDDAPIVPFLSYLLAMQLVALLLAQWGTGGKWWTLRGLSIVPQIFWMYGILGGRHGHEPAICAFLVVYAIFYHAELIVAALRGHAGRFAGSAMAIATTAAFVAGLMSYYANASSSVRGDWIMTIAVFSAALGLVLPRIDDKLGRLAIAHRIAAAALLVLWVPISTSGIRIEAGWMVLGVAFAALWGLTASPVSRVAAPITWVLGLTVLALSAMDHGVGNVWLTISSTAIGSNIVLAWLFALSGHLIATLIGLNRLRSRNNSQWETTGRFVGLLSALIWFGASIGGLPPLGATTSIIAYAWVLLGGEIGLPGGLGEIAFAALLIATIKWAAVDTLNARLSSDWTTTRPVFNPLMGVGAAGVSSLLAFARWLKKPQERLPDSRLCLAAAVIGLMTLGFSFEIDRVVGRIEAAGWQYVMNPWEVRQLSWTILWSVALSAILVAVRRNVRWMNGVWAIVLLLVGKFLLLDTIWPLMSDRSAATPILNLDVLAGASVLGCISIARILLSARGESAAITRYQIPNLAAVLIGWMGTLEIARFVARVKFPSESAGHDWHLKNLGWTMWWTVVAGSALWLGWRSDRKAGRDDIHAPWLTVWPVVLAAIAVKFIGIDAINWRMEHVPISGWPVLVNLDILTALIVMGGMILPCRLSLPPAALDAGYGLRLRKSAATLSVAILLVSGSLEVDRLFHIVSVFNPELAEQFGLSIFWSSFAVLALACGFWQRAASLRYFSLGLLAITLLKVVVIDLSQVGYGYRVLSFIGLGLLLLGTSVMYGKVSPKLLGEMPAKG